MKLVDDWHWIVNHAWSVRLLILSALLTGVDAATPFFLNAPTAWNSLVAFVISAAALVSRFVAQERPAQ